MMLRQWPEVLNTLEPQNWAELEFLRYGFLARAFREQRLEAASKAEWERALKAAGTRRESLNMLLRMAAQWNWPTEAEGILWTTVNRYPNDRGAFRALTELLYVSGRTRPLMTLYSQRLKTPSDLDGQTVGSPPQRGQQAADPREVYDKAGTNAFYASTYAFSLHLQDKNAEALKVFAKLKPQELEEPSIGTYYGMVLRAAGQGAQAKKYLELAAKARLLPEEKKLVEKAKAGI
jgi:hypothetical protein